MSRRLDYGHDFRKRQAAYGLSVKDEAEWMQDDAAPSDIALDPDRKRWFCGGSALQAARGKALVLRCARVAGPVGAGIDVERPRGALDDLFRDYDFLYAFEAR